MWLELLSVQGRERASVDELNALAQKVRDARDRYDAIKASNGGKRDREDFYLVVCFRDTDDLTDFLAAAGLPVAGLTEDDEP